MFDDDVIASIDFVAIVLASFSAGAGTAFSIPAAAPRRAPVIMICLEEEEVRRRARRERASVIEELGKEKGRRISTAKFFFEF